MAFRFPEDFQRLLRRFFNAFQLLSSGCFSGGFKWISFKRSSRGFQRCSRGLKGCFRVLQECFEEYHRMLGGFFGLFLDVSKSSLEAFQGVSGFQA